MLNNLLLTATLISLLSSVSASCSEEIKGVYRDPDQIKGLPTAIKQELNKMNCKIPQGIMNHTNAIKGEFAVKGQKDWAVLCSNGGKSHIHIFWGGPEQCPSAIAERSDDTDLYKQPDGNWEFNRGLGKVEKKFIIDHYEAYGGPKPPPIRHEAIDDRWLEKASVVHYCHKGQWIELTGAD